VQISGVGVWSAELRFGDAGEIEDAAVELEELGYSALWIPDVGGDVMGAIEVLLARTNRVVIATGILNLWMHDLQQIAARRGSWRAEWQARVLLGLGISHAPLIDQDAPGRYRAPIETTRRFLGQLDAAEPPLPRDARLLAALGPRMLALARDDAAGAHPYLVPPDHTRGAREILGTAKILAPEQGVVLETDPQAARTIARAALSHYTVLPNYVNNWRRLGFTEEDLAGGGTDRLIDSLFAWGDAAAIADRVQAHVDAGADHVCIQVLHGGSGLPRTEWRELAAALVPARGAR
jgi:probable F420-dependent oxidoreductase